MGNVDYKLKHKRSGPAARRSRLLFSPTACTSFLPLLVQTNTRWSLCSPHLLYMMHPRVRTFYWKSRTSTCPLPKSPFDWVDRMVLRAVITKPVPPRRLRTICASRRDCARSLRTKNKRPYRRPSLQYPRPFPYLPRSPRCLRCPTFPPSRRLASSATAMPSEAPSLSFPPTSKPTHSPTSTPSSMPSSMPSEDPDTLCDIRFCCPATRLAADLLLL